MSLNPVRYALAPQMVSSATAVTAAALTSGLGGVPLPQIPPQYLYPGIKLIIDALLEITSGSATPTLTLDFRIGLESQAISAKTILAQSSALALPASVTAGPCIMHYEGRFRSLNPSTGSIYGQGVIKQVSSLTAFGSDVPFPITAAARLVSTLNTDQLNVIDVGVTLSATTGSPSVTVADLAAELAAA